MLTREEQHHDYRAWMTQPRIFDLTQNGDRCQDLYYYPFRLLCETNELKPLVIWNTATCNRNNSTP